MHTRWDEGAAATPHGQLVFFMEFSVRQVLDIDATIQPLYGSQESAELGYNPSRCFR